MIEISFSHDRKSDANMKQIPGKQRLCHQISDSKLDVRAYQEARRASWLEPPIHEKPQGQSLRSSSNEVKSVLTEVRERKAILHHFNPYIVALVINLLEVAELDYIVYIWVKLWFHVNI